jgi:hypothetical protein
LSEKSATSVCHSRHLDTPLKKIQRAFLRKHAIAALHGKLDAPRGEKISVDLSRE